MLFNFKSFSKVYYAVYILLSLIVLGTLGFMIVEGYDFLDAFFMTIITVSTVGFESVGGQLSDGGKIFTSFLIITSFGTFAYAVSAITIYLVGGEYEKYFKDFRTLKRIEKLNNHIIICGCGRVGKQASAQLGNHRQKYVIIENKQSIIESLRKDANQYVIEGDATLDESLINAGIKKASAIITTLPSDSDNLFVVLTAKELNSNITVISRASKDTSYKRLKSAGADNVIMPDSLGGALMASLVITPDVMKFIDSLMIQGSSNVNLEEIRYNDLPDKYQKNTIGELQSDQITGCNIIGFKSPEGEILVNPSPDTPLENDAKLFVLGTPEQIEALQ